jgi:putative ABC transport system permease protein
LSLRRRFRVDVLEGARIAVFSLQANRMRTVLTTLGIGIGVATLLAIVGIIQGLNSSFHKQLATLGANTLYVSKWPWMVKGNWWVYRNRKNITLEQLSALRSQADFITAISPAVMRTSDVSHGALQVSNVRVNGVWSDYQAIGNYEVVAGRFLTRADEEVNRAVVVVGSDVAATLFPGLSPLGQTVRIDGRPFMVIGSLARKGKVVNENMDMAVYMPFKTFNSNFGKWRPMQIAISVADAGQMQKVEDQLVGMMRRIRATPPGAPDDFSINRPDTLAATYEELTGALYAVATGVGLITLLVGGIGIMNIMLVSVRERTREIGVRRALGAHQRTIVLQFLMEASSVSAVGGFLGTSVGLGTAKLVSLVTPLAADVRMETVVGGVAFAALVGLLFGIWPAARAARLDPVEALRYE